MIGLGLLAIRIHAFATISKLEPLDEDQTVHILSSINCVLGYESFGCHSRFLICDFVVFWC
jgi:hypothetical protein